MHQKMLLALEEAKLALSEGEVPIGAVIFCENEIIGRGHNRKEKFQDPTAHAEILAIRQAAEKLHSWRLSHCSLYVTAEPCPMCMGAIIQAKIPLLVYGTPEPTFGGVESTVRLSDHPACPKNMVIYGGIYEEECRSLLESFFVQQRSMKK